MTETTPLSASSVTLAVRDLTGVASFYQRLLGLTPRPGPAGQLNLAAGGQPLLHLRAAPEARPESGREPGLFHTAFLMPDRKALAGWLHHAAELGLTLQGASDHGVSEAIYFSDPEGNGIEVYADRPRAAWPAPGDGQAIGMFTRRLDLPALMATAAGRGPTDGLRIGHVHLRAHDVPAAEAFYAALGLEVTQRIRGASFLATGGYHHHVAVNTWASGGAPRRPAGLSGLLEMELRAADQASFDHAAEALRRAGAVLEEAPGMLRAEDPAGLGLRLSLT
ncbi:VOC family protein [Roseomonas marmotae]|uniref:VOC family protein n=1 Tax=Roseomonas marmotae TaxID=2768161 RepID=A0ABS3KCE8_9PROT|nr:VOC family protein [Roseomonas marmotae]MBO1075146.1 VOC family protein [Roseomonas marmotae]QTI79742.1 VOC family protein [Roseomonas marmotae]